MKSVFVPILFVLSMFASMVANAQIYWWDSWPSTQSLVCSHFAPITDNYRFNIELLDTLNGRIDSIFRHHDVFHEYSFRSYSQRGELIAMGMFHMHDSFQQMSMSSKTEEFLLSNRPDQVTIHVLYWYAPYQGQWRSYVADSCPYYPLSKNNFRPGILWGGETGFNYLGDEIRKMPGR